MAEFKGTFIPTVLILHNSLPIIGYKGAMFSESSNSNRRTPRSYKRNKVIILKIPNSSIVYSIITKYIIRVGSSNMEQTNVMSSDAVRKMKVPKHDMQVKSNFPVTVNHFNKFCTEICRIVDY